MDKNFDDFFEETKWPFKKMAVGDVVSFNENQARAQMCAHVYGRQLIPSRKFKTKTDKATGILYVKRIA